MSIETNGGKIGACVAKVTNTSYEKFLEASRVMQADIANMAVASQTKLTEEQKKSDETGNQIIGKHIVNKFFNDATIKHVTEGHVNEGQV